MHAEPNEWRSDDHVENRLPEGEEKPPRGAKAMAWVRWLLLLGVLVAAVYTNVTHFVTERGDAAASKAAFYCPMHPQITSDREGECPICHMKLEPIPKERLSASPSGSAHDHRGHTHEGHETSAEHVTGAKYVCPMCPGVESDEPGRCPICHMYLERVVPKGEHVTEGVTPGTTPSGTVPIVLSLDRMQAIGVRTTRVVRQTIDAPLRVTATVMAPEQGQAFVHARAAGYVERASVQQTGVRVRKGQELVALYSPEIFQAQAELLASQAWKGDVSHEAARTKLELLGVAPKTIDKILETKKPLRAIPITSPVDGWVVKKNVALGSYVTPEVPLFEIVDLSRVYVVAEVFPKDARRIELGSEARFTLAGRDGTTFTGTIDLVYPTLSPTERTTRVRMQLKNTDAALRPGDYGTVEIASKASEALVVPRDAIVDTGASTYVFVVEGEGRLVPRIVALGQGHDDLVEVKDGVSEGESVVSSATFLIDSESRLQASLTSNAH